MEKGGNNSYRWIVLAVFMLAALVSQLLWLTFAPISSEAREIYGVDAFHISTLSLVWPLVFVITAIPVGIFIDKKGFKKSVGVGVVIMAIFSIARVFSTYPSPNFTLLLISQTGCSFSQAFIFGSITKMTVSWFPENEQGIADGLATIGLFLGMMLALVLTPYFFTSFGLQGVLSIYAIISCFIAALFLLLARENEGKVVEEIAFTLKDLWNLSKLKNFSILEYGFFAGVGGFTAIMTWLEEILHELHNLSIENAGLAGGALIIGGIVGAIVIPALSDKAGRIKPFVVFNLFMGAMMLSLLGFVERFAIIVAICFTMGFFLMSILPLVLELSGRIAGRGMEGRASSMLWFYSQVGSIILIAIIEPLKKIGGSYVHPLTFISILWLIALLLFLMIKEGEIKNHTS